MKPSVELKVVKIVGYTNPNPDKRFGFTVDSIFFHFDQQHLPICDGSETPYLQGNFNRAVDPVKGNEIICDVTEGKKGKKVLWWAFKLLWDSTLEAIKSRPHY